MTGFEEKGFLLFLTNHIIPWGISPEQPTITSVCVASGIMSNPEMTDSMCVAGGGEVMMQACSPRAGEVEAGGLRV